MAESRTHILVTTDFSEASIEAFGPAAQLARELGGRITLLYALPKIDSHPTGSPFVSPVKIPTTAEQARLAKADLAELQSRFGADVEVTVDAAAGPTIHEAILDYADRHGVDLIAIGTHGRSGLRRLVLGSVTEQVLRHSRVPVLVIPRPAG